MSFSAFESFYRHSAQTNAIALHGLLCSVVESPIHDGSCRVVRAATTLSLDYQSSSRASSVLFSILVSAILIVSGLNRERMRNTVRQNPDRRVAEQRDWTNLD